MPTPTAPPPASPLVRRAVIVRGAVQGVGYRPFIYRLATELELTGWVLNSAQGLFVEVEGTPGGVDSFCRLLQLEAPPRAMVQGLEISELPVAGYTNFTIRHSEESGPKTTVILPDLATCPECRREIFDPHNRRHGYPFTNCTNCGPRYSIIHSLPYDRPNTAMAGFLLCPRCQAEYDDPTNRRFHAQPNACPDCGPQLALWNNRGQEMATRNDALHGAADAIRQGLIVAVKGVGGFHLLVDARNNAAVERLRQRKDRPSKPFAVMFPSQAQIELHCALSAPEAALLGSPAAPIVLLRHRAEPRQNQPQSGKISPAVAPDNPTLGVFLPYTPLHHLLLAELGFPVVATSGNLSDEPICIDNDEALQRLGGIADYFLVHDRPIQRPMDDSVARILAGEIQILRRSRGYAPLPFVLIPGIGRRHPADPQSPDPFPESTVLAVGGHMKNTVALSVGGNVFLSQHLGDLENAHSFAAFQQAIDDLISLYEAKPDCIVCDSHPDYPSARHAARLAEKWGVPLRKVQHHYAHLLSCMAENGLRPPVLGVVWDGTGYGDDGTIWGGEFLLAREDGWQRVAHLRPFRLPGGETAVREPRRSAFGLLHERFGSESLGWKWLDPVASLRPAEKKLIGQMLERGINAPVTTSAGRLFDGVAALLGLCQRSTFEGEAAMALEFAAQGQSAPPYRFILQSAANGPLVIDWGPLLEGLLTDSSQGETMAHCAARFHSTLAEMIVAVAQRVSTNATSGGTADVALTGGCFQNRLLSELTIARLRAAGFRPHWHRQVPANDGGIALGQVLGMTG